MTNSSTGGFCSNHHRIQSTTKDYPDKTIPEFINAKQSDRNLVVLRSLYCV
ncbi:MAG: hypothetical protein NW224_27770 [Leptolyngbyaceae cyanobacterium bins.302]|nr:hypothetical protein [Leptolyngbyaceae cyanobacterium bins.302]